MNFIMLAVVSLLAAFFVVPYPTLGLNWSSTDISSFYPCQSGKMIKYKEANGGCEHHAGYFMAYRVYFAYVTFLFTNCLLMIRVSNTKDDPYRSKCHHGFWFYKYLYLTVLLFVFFFMLNGERDKEGIFEFTASIIGNVAHSIFSFIEVTFVLDLVELWVHENKTNKGRWNNFIYGGNTFLLFLFSAILYVKIWLEYSTQRIFSKEKAEWPDWPNDNCIDGEKRFPDWKHTGLILATTTVIILLIIVMTFRKLLGADKRFPYTGWMQTAIMIIFNLSYLWSSLTNSSNIHSRPRCNTGIDFFSNPRHNDPSEGVRSGSLDVYFGPAGLYHGLLCLMSLFYFAFVHGPRSNTAPLSILYCYILRVVDRIPAYPDEEDEEAGIPLGYLQAIEQSKVWDDEEAAVAQSWSLFYFMMILGSLSLMMAMTNFTNPWAADHYNSSNVAFYTKFGTASIVTFIYILMLISQCAGIHAYGTRGQKLRRRSVKDDLQVHFEASEFDEEDSEEAVHKPEGQWEVSEEDSAKSPRPPPNPAEAQGKSTS